ncbi:Serine/threonine protein kinase [uncultured Synechococcales cyanobacterium]|uniref:Serine/threonine protein kinase n=1 Tax=uncultured Synechococcales cyanobacterium TaxID=1936017 RepID=A0A6J4VT28_9CYAN|nr:Serine/threonine protein kinase [uncultured Synechococcales cyanobacterium]
MRNSSDPNIGQLLSNRYLLLELVGKGSMGHVYRADDVLLGKVPVAVKFLARTLLTEGMKVRFAHEARTGAQLGQKSIHVVRVIDYGVNQSEVPFYVMEYLQGKNLSDVLSVCPLSVPRFLVIARHVCLGLQCAHQGVNVKGKLCPIIHRDVKPSNVLLVQDPSLGELAKVLDFGIAQFLSDQIDSNQTQPFMGTPAYCSPEQMKGSELDSRSDIYSLGVMMFEMLTGKLPVQPDTHTLSGWSKAHRFQTPTSLQTVNPGLQLPRSLHDLIVSCLAKLQGDRPQSIGEILKCLESYEQMSATGQGFQPYSQTLAHQATHVPKSYLPTLIEDVCWQATWPADKPRAEIVFPHLVQTSHNVAAALWVMMPHAEIQKRFLSTRYNQFLCLIAPHPMVLWITTIYDRSSGPRWLPCYLDLKHPRSFETASLLGEAGYYPLLFFGLEAPQKCVNVMTLAIAPYQCHLLQDWLQLSQDYTSTAAPNITKGLLKAEFERLKPQILQKLKGSSQRVEAWRPNSSNTF